MGRRLAAAVLLAAVLAGISTACGEGTAASAEAELPGEKLIALTFDDGPGRGNTEALLDILEAEQVPATFFLVGAEIGGQEALVRRMAAQGHQIGNHSWSHRRLGTGEALLEEVRRTDLKLTEVLGEGDYWLRPPYGLLEDSAGLSVPVIRWSVDPRDWESRDADAVLEHVLRHAEPGAIILLHDIYPSSVEAAERIIEALKGQGYRFVTVRELLGAGGITPEPGKSYSRG